MKKIADLMSLNGRRALITGAAGKIGSEIALTIAELGGDLILVDRPDSDYSSLKQKILDNWNVDIQCISCDLESENSRVMLIDSIIKSNNRLDILINNAAFVGDSSLDGWVDNFSQQSVETWNRALAVNLTAVFHLSQGLTPLLKKNKNGSIINISSIYPHGALDLGEDGTPDGVGHGGLRPGRLVLHPAEERREIEEAGGDLLELCRSIDVHLLLSLHWLSAVQQSVVGV